MRRALMQNSRDLDNHRLDFLEFAPENWIGVGGRWQRLLRQHTEKFPCVLHGLALSLGGQAPLDEDLLQRIRNFMDTHGIAYYSEHLSFTGDESPLYELLPIPFTEEAAVHTAERVSRAQEILNRRIAIENASYYMATDVQNGAEAEADFMLDVVARSGCKILLDVNNCICNAHNHDISPTALIDKLDKEQVAYLHVAGHKFLEEENIIIDTHGAEVPESVWYLLADVYSRFGPIATLLERDSNIPPLDDLLKEVDRIRATQLAYTNKSIH